MNFVLNNAIAQSMSHPMTGEIWYGLDLVRGRLCHRCPMLLEQALCKKSCRHELNDAVQRLSRGETWVGPHLQDLQHAARQTA